MNSEQNSDIHENSIEIKIIDALDKIAQALKNSLWERGKKFHLSPTQIQVLLFLNSHPENKNMYRTVSYISREFNLTKGTMSEVIKTLERKKLIRKTSDKNDYRKFYIHITPKGKEIANQLLVYAKDLHTFLKSMGNDRNNKLFNDLLDIVLYLYDKRMINLQRMCFNCKYYRNNYKESLHYCSLLNMPLRQEDIRIDCPEHEVKEDKD